MTRPSVVRAACVGGAALLGAVVWGELVTWAASRAAIPARALDASVLADGDVVLVLGFASSRHGRVNAIQRWRTRIAVRSVDPRTAWFVFSGAVTRGTRSEASLMADFAVDVLGIDPARVVLEEQARSTWENIAFSVPIIRGLLADGAPGESGAPSIRIASNTFHAWRGRRYLARQAPDLAPLVRRARDFVPGEFALVKPVLAAYECRRRLRERRRLRADRRLPGASAGPATSAAGPKR